MNPDAPLPSAPGFWKTLVLLLSVARRRASGRMSRQRALLHERTGSSTDALGLLGTVMFWVVTAAINIVAALTVQLAITEAQTAEIEQQGKVLVRTYVFERAIRKLANAKTDAAKSEAQRELNAVYVVEAQRRTQEIGGSEEENGRFLLEAIRTRSPADFVHRDDVKSGFGNFSTTGPLPLMFGSVFLGAWLLMLICQGEGLELDIQRRRHPVWEWLFSHPVRPGAVFLAEMLSPITANPIYATGPLFIGFLYGSIYGNKLGLAAALLIGVPVSIAAACLGKALEIGIMLRFAPRSRGALIGLMSWLGYAMMLAIFVCYLSTPRIVGATGNLLQPLANAVPWVLFSWATGLKSDGSFSFSSGMVACWIGSALMIAGSVAFSVWGAQRGVIGSAGTKPISPAKAFSAARLFKADPLYRKEILWFLRDRGAIIQAILIPLTLAGFEVFNLRMFYQGMRESWQSFSGIAVVFGTYFLWVLGPRSLASEGQALWVAQTWPRGLEDLMKAKARLWFLIATLIVLLILTFGMVRFPSDTWKIALIAVGWMLFGRSMAEKSVTLVTVTSSSGEQEPIPKGRRYAAALGMLTFAVGILTARWHLAVIGIVYSWITAAAMWENFRARLPFLFDPWSERVPPPPTLMHAMVAISLLVEGGAVFTGLCIFLLGVESVAFAQALAFGITAIMVSLGTTAWLKDHDVSARDVWYWRKEASNKRFFTSISIGVAGGLLLGLLGNGYVWLMLRFSPFAEMIRDSEEQIQSVPELRLSYAVMAIAFAPFAEEYLFRGLLFRALDRAWGGWLALLGSAAFFTIYHQPIAWLPVFLVGVATALVFKKTGWLAAAVVLHMVYNAVVVL